MPFKLVDFEKRNFLDEGLPMTQWSYSKSHSVKYILKSIYSYVTNKSNRRYFATKRHCCYRVCTYIRVIKSFVNPNVSRGFPFDREFVMAFQRNGYSVPKMVPDLKSTLFSTKACLSINELSQKIVALEGPDIILLGIQLC